MGQLKVNIDDIEADVASEDAALAEIAKAAASKPSLSPVKNASSNRSGQTPAPARSQIVRRGYSMPEDDHDIIDSIIGRLVAADMVPLRQAANSSFILRLALHALKGRTDEELATLLKAVPPIASGRPAEQS